MKSANMRYCNSGVISHEICNHEICWLWCNISSNLNPWDTGYWTYIYRYDILDSVIQSIIQGQSNQFINLGNNSNQSNQSMKTADQTSASFERFRSCWILNREIMIFRKKSIAWFSSISFHSEVLADDDKTLVVKKLASLIRPRWYNLCSLSIPWVPKMFGGKAKSFVTDLASGVCPLWSPWLEKVRFSLHNVQILCLCNHQFQ